MVIILVNIKTIYGDNSLFIFNTPIKHSDYTIKKSHVMDKNINTIFCKKEVGNKVI